MTAKMTLFWGQARAQITGSISLKIIGSRTDPFLMGIDHQDSTLPTPRMARPSPHQYGVLPLAMDRAENQALTVADFNGDGAKDIVFGSMSEQNIRITSTPATTSSATPNAYDPGGVTGLHPATEPEGGIDLLVTRSGLGCDGAGPQATLRLLRNREAEVERDWFEVESVLASMNDHITMPSL